MPHVNGPKKWRVQINRQKVVLACGCYEYPDEAARAFDNAAFHTREWASGAVSLNFPNELPAPPTARTLAAIERLKTLFPNWRAAKQADEGLTEFQKVEKEGLLAAAETVTNMTKVRTALGWAFGKLRLQEILLQKAQEKIDTQARIIEGLRATGGQNPFRPISVPTSPLEEVLPPKLPLPDIPAIDDHLT